MAARRPFLIPEIGHLARMGVSLTAMGTALLYILGVEYYSGVFSVYDVPRLAIKPDWQDAIRPNAQSLLALYHVVLGYIATHYQMRRLADQVAPVHEMPPGRLEIQLGLLKRAAGKEVAHFVPPSRLETRLSLLFSLLSLVGLSFFLTTGREFAALSMFGGAALGVVLALSQRLRLPDLRFLILGIAALLLAVHAGFAGVNDAPRLLAPIRIKPRTGEEAEGARLYECASGVYYLTTHEPPELTYVPRTEIQYLTFSRRAR